LRNAALGDPLTGHTESVLSVAFSPDGRTLASASADGTVLLWDVSDPAHPRRLGDPLIHFGFGTSVAFSPDGRTLATVDVADLLLWDVSDPAHPRRLGDSRTGHNGAVHSVAFSPDGRTLATASLDNTVLLWDLGGLSIVQAHQWSAPARSREVASTRTSGHVTYRGSTTSTSAGPEPALHRANGGRRSNYLLGRAFGDRVLCQTAGRWRSWP